MHYQKSFSLLLQCFHLLLTTIIIDIFSPSLNRLYHKWTCVLLIVDSPNTAVNISHVLAQLISFFTQNWIQFLWSNFSKSTPKHDKTFYLSKTNWQSKMADIVNIYEYNRYVYQCNRKKCENGTYVAHEIWK